MIDSRLTGVFVTTGLSIVKTLIYSFLYKKNDFLLGDVYRSNTKYDLVLKSVSLINGNFDEFCDDMKYILSAIDLLIINEIVEEVNSELFIKTKRQHSIISNAFIEKAITAAEDISDRQMLREVISCV